MQQHTDEQLVALLAEGQTAALAELVRRHQQMVIGLAMRLLGRHDAAEDVAQDTFIRVYRAAPKYRPDAKFTTWLYRIVVNLSHDARRKARHKPLPLTSELSATLGAESPDALGQAERAAHVQRAVDALPERQRTVIILHRYQDLSHREVADATGWSASAVESLLVRAYANLRQALEDEK